MDWDRICFSFMFKRVLKLITFHIAFSYMMYAKNGTKMQGAVKNKRCQCLHEFVKHELNVMLSVTAFSPEISKVSNNKRKPQYHVSAAKKLYIYLVWYGFVYEV